MERLNKYLAHAGVGSRRHCDDLIAAGRVRIDGQAVRELGLRIDPAGHEITVDGQPVTPERLVYWAVNKPRGYLCTNHDQQGRPRALDLIDHVGERVYTVGRLDEDSEGLLLMTNDGDLAFKLMHPRFGVYKTYLVLVAGKPSREDLQKLLDGVWLSDGHVKAKRVKRLKQHGDSTWLEIVLAEGKNREVRRMLAKLEHKVMRLKRIAIGPLRLDRLSKGKSRKLRKEEVESLRRACERKPRQKEERPQVEEARPRRERPDERAEGRKPGKRAAEPVGARPRDKRAARPFDPFGGNDRGARPRHNQGRKRPK
jgi:23S rRNA pseudouridine2605 synthase